MCYLCHRYCLTCTNKYDYSCSACAYSYYKWQHTSYGNRCGYFCNEGLYDGTRLGEYVDPTYGSDPDRRCAVCAAGCKYCASTATTCYECYDTYYLLDDKASCLALFTCPQCQLSGSGGIVTDGCHSVDKHCRASNCPAYFYFPVRRTGSGDFSSTDARYNYFTEAVIMNYGANKYAPSSDPRTTNNSYASPYSNIDTHYRKLTNFCKLCDFRCMKCTGPTNF